VAYHTPEIPGGDKEIMEKNRELTPLEALETFIERGSPPDILGHDFNSKGIPLTTFRWNDGTVLYFKYNIKTHIDLLRRFVDFWSI
jgi:hypothetical protein